MRYLGDWTPIRRWGFWACVVVFGVAALVALVISPVALLVLSQSFSLDWNRLSDIGQAYGAISAVFAGAAVAGVALSIARQTRQLRVSVIQAQRMLQFEVMKLMIGDPALRAVSPSSTGSSTAEWKMHIVTNLLFVSLLMGYETGEISKGSLRESMSHRFEVPFAREFWPRVRASYAANASTSRRREFLEVADRELERAMKAGPAKETITVRQAGAEVARSYDATTRSGVKASLATSAVILIAGLIVWRYARQRRR